MDLTITQVIGFKIRISLIKKRMMEEKCLSQYKEVESLAECGEQVTYLIPCLDPDKAETKKFNYDLARQRYLADTDPIMKIATVAFDLE